jgi:hypothetical protein
MSTQPDLTPKSPLQMAIASKRARQSYNAKAQRRKEENAFLGFRQRNFSAENAGTKAYLF